MNKTALIVCDVWADYWCISGKHQMDELALRINQFAESARKAGVLIIHSPSETVDKQYYDAPQRRRAAAYPPDHGASEEMQGHYTIPLGTEKTSGCVDVPLCDWNRDFLDKVGQHPAIRIDAGDLITESAKEIFGVLSAGQISAVLLCGSHLNGCLLSRSFGVAALKRRGISAWVVEDLCEIIYSPEDFPHVSVEEARQLMLRYVKNRWCPTISSDEFLSCGLPSPGLITMKNLGRMGRFGNQLLQYIFLRVYANIYNLRLQTPPWVGQTLFGFSDPPITEELPEYVDRLVKETWVEAKMGPQTPPIEDEAVNRDFVGYAQYDMTWYENYRPYIQRLLQPTALALERVRPGLEKLRGLGKTLIGIHLRRGDYGRLLYYRAPIEWYLKAIHNLWKSVEDPVLFIATQDLGLVGEFSEYDPVTIEHLGIRFSGAPDKYQDLQENIERQHRSLDFFPEWYYLAQCDMILAPNSTFSFTAALANQAGCRYFRSCLPRRAIVETDLWYTTPLEHELAENYKDVPGLCLTHNPPHWYRCDECNGRCQVKRLKQMGRRQVPRYVACPKCNGIGSTVTPPDWWLERQKSLRELAR